MGKRMQEGAEAGQRGKRMSQPRMEPESGGERMRGISERTEIRPENQSKGKGWPEEGEECWRGGCRERITRLGE